MKIHVSSMSIFRVGILNKPQAFRKQQIVQLEYKALHTRGKGAVLVSKEIFVLVSKVEASEGPLVKPTRLGGQKMISNLF